MEVESLLGRATEGTRPTTDFGGSQEFKEENRGTDRDIWPSTGLETPGVNRLLRRRSPGDDFSFGELGRNEGIASNFQSTKSAMSSKYVHDSFSPSPEARSLRDKRNSNPCRASGFDPVNTDQERKLRECEQEIKVNSCEKEWDLSELLGFCPSGCLCDNVQLAVQCLSGKMDVVPILLNPGTIHLDLSHNRIKTILPGFAFYHELKVLNVSFNEIVALGESNFVSQVALNVLIIKNNKISKLDDRAFVGLSSLEELDASNNYIEYIHSNTFLSLSNLNKVDLSGNRIRALSSDVFRNLTKLTTLDLCKNLLIEIPSNLFDPLINLKELYLCSNEITVLRDTSFVTLRRLSFLSLQSNKIEFISEDAFSGLQSLVELSLYGNLLTSIPTSQMRLITNLEGLDLSLNLISSIPASSFASLTRLKKLSVSQCSTLSRIDLKAFDTLSSLTALELNFSPLLLDFQIEVLRPLSDLRRLILRGNGIKTLSKDLLDIGHLQYVDLRDNEFNCECTLKWLKEARRNASLDVEIEDVICAAPDAVRGKSISALTEYDFRCFGHLITIAISAAVTLTVLLLLVIAFAIYYKNCRKMKTLVHDNWPDKIVTTWRDTDYQKQELNGGQPQDPSSPGEEFLEPSSQDPHDELMRRTKSRQTSLQRSTSMITKTVNDVENSQAAGQHRSRVASSSGDPLNASELEGPYASVAITSGGQYDSPHVLGGRVFAPTNSIYLDRKTTRTFQSRPQKMNGASLKFSKDSGYYSCEFLDHSSNSSPQSDGKSSNNGNEKPKSVNHYRDPQLFNSNSRKSLRGGRLAPSDSGVFTLSRSYSKPARLAQAPSDGIYDNIL
ncbi:Leucine-rich repeat [Trinorchestia longiramus]|nr:Leucine-rich repeat [Trinorchestia longiramus]